MGFRLKRIPLYPAVFVPQRMDSDDFDDFLTFPLVPSFGQNLNLQYFPSA